MILTRIGGNVAQGSCSARLPRTLPLATPAVFSKISEDFPSPQRTVQAAVAIQRLTVEVSKQSGEAYGPELGNLRRPWKS